MDDHKIKIAIHPRVLLAGIREARDETQALQFGVEVLKIAYNSGLEDARSGTRGAFISNLLDLGEGRDKGDNDGTDKV